MKVNIIWKYECLALVFKQADSTKAQVVAIETQRITIRIKNYNQNYVRQKTTAENQ